MQDVSIDNEDSNAALFELGPELEEPNDAFHIGSESWEPMDEDLYIDLFGSGPDETDLLFTDKGQVVGSNPVIPSDTENENEDDPELNYDSDDFFRSQTGDSESETGSSGTDSEAETVKGREVKLDSLQLKSLLIRDGAKSTQLGLENADEHYRFEGLVCQHSGTPQCAVLRALGLIYNPDLQILIDPKTYVAVLSGAKVDIKYASCDLSSILKQRLPVQDHVALRAHLAKTYGLSAANTPDALCKEIRERNIIPVSIPGLLPPNLFKDCSICQRAYVHNPPDSNGLSKHKNRHRTTHGGLDVRAVPQFWGVHLFGEARHLYGLVAKVSSHHSLASHTEAASPLLQPSASMLSSMSSLPEFILNIKWSYYLAMQSEMLPRLASLVESARAPPSSLEIQRRPGWSKSNDRIEIILSLLRQALMTYLKDAESRLQNARPEIRAHVTHSANGALRELVTSSMSAYTSTILRIMSFILRVWHQDSNSINMVPFPFLWRGTQKEAIRALHSKMKEDEPPTSNELQLISHEFLAAAFEGAIDQKTPIASVLEQGLLFLMIHPTRGWDKPSIFQAHLNHILYFSRMVKTQVGFLGGFALPYVPFIATDSEEVLDNTIPRSGTPDLFDLSDLDVGSPSNFTGESEAIMYFMEEGSLSFRCRDGGGQMQRISTFWVHSSAAISKMAKSAQIAWSPDGKMLTFSAPYANVKVDFLKHSRAAAEICDGGLEEQFKIAISLFSSDNIPLEFEGITVQDFADIHTEDNLFHQAGNATLLSSRIERLSHAALKLDQPHKISALKGAETFRKHLLLAIIITSGIPMRARQYAMLQYFEKDNFHRNIFVTEGMVIISKPRAKQYFLRSYNAHWALPGSVGLCLLFYLGVVRPVEILLAQDVACHSALEEMKYFIFATPFSKRPTTVIWKGKKVNNTLRNNISTIKGECRVWRHVIQGFMHKHVPLALAVKDDQTQRSQLAVSRAFQAILLRQTTPSFDSSIPQHIPPMGLLLARHLSRSHAASFTEPTTLAKNLADSLKFMSEPLVQICSALLFAGNQPGPFAVAPLHGFPPSTLELSQTLIFLAFSEPGASARTADPWASYSALHLFLTTNEALQKARKHFYNTTLAVYRDTENWHALSKAILSCAQSEWSLTQINTL